MTVLIDSWAWIEYWKGGQYSKKAALYIEGDEEAIVSTINLAEVYFWVMKYYNEDTTQRKVSTIEKRCHVMPVDRGIALESAKIKKALKLALADSIILATARSVEGRVVTGDLDFRNISDVILLSK